MEYIQIIIAGILTLLGVYLGYFLSKKQAKDQSLMEARRIVYSKLLSAVFSEENYPREIAGTKDSYIEEKVAEYNIQVDKWRQNRKILKGVASEALLITESPELQKKLSDFVHSYNPDDRAVGLEEHMRKEIGI